ncbi:GNAT family N-acetyltransferase [Celeribacter indicus]|uniref:N-acetyltransferase domain-containing protein n=1 Tax=Celeribacter indicus TaxID=1208324 RepID=A0A0B5E5D1_9RHOB|nr:GNAT family N-acetyltransferase [Celeribacter indicus]AJE48176.1 hypothetical protein P73_3461 [Celeribacter indicus]SDW68567.1 Acetyltransferase (GNAT) domain-containing protein [Celeribacter indicus]
MTAPSCLAPARRARYIGGMNLRPLTPADAAACYALFHRTVHGGTGAFYSAEQRAAWAPARDRAPETWPERLTSGFAICATRRGRIVGFFTMGHDGHIDFAYVALEEMGRGTAGRLYDACEAEARRLGLPQMDTAASHLARRFFEKRGWRVTARQTVIRASVGIENFRMEKSLPPGGDACHPDGETRETRETGIARRRGRRMTRWSIRIAALALLGLAGAAGADPLATARRMAEAFLRGDVETVWQAATPQMREAFGSVDDLAGLREGLRRDLGTEDTILSESVETQSGHEVFTRLSRWSGSAVPVELVVALDGTGRIAGFLVRPQPVAAPSPHLEYETKARLRLPVEGDWHVYWGGREIGENYHAADPGQRFALDILVLEEGQSHSGDPAEPASYQCWGRPILAPAEGVVVRAVDGLPDQPIGRLDPAHPAGNHVVIDFGQGEYGFLAHLQEGSLRVAQGDRVTAGQDIGLCGNSGNSSEPHLHFHLQTTPDLGRGEGLPAQFTHYLADGQRVERGEPVKGQTIRALP